MSLTDVLLLLVVIGLAYIGITLKLIGAAVERIAGVSHYQQQSVFKPGIRADKAPVAPTPARPVQTTGLVDITAIPEEQALDALEGWGIK